MEFENDFSLKEWAKDKPLSILQLDPADRAVLRIAVLQDIEVENLLNDSEIEDFIPSDEDAGDPPYILRPDLVDSSSSDTENEEVLPRISASRGRGDRRGRRARACRTARTRGGSTRDRPTQETITNGSQSSDNEWLTSNFNPKDFLLSEPAYLFVNTEDWTQIDYFRQYIDDDLINMIVEKTNQTAIKITGRSLNLNTNECYVYLGITMIMASVNYPHLRMYWSNKWRVNIIASNMSRNRFTQLRNSLKFVFDDDISRETRAKDRLWKVRPLLDRIRSGCLAQEKLKKICIDEMIVPFTGSCGVKQYCPGKPNPEGLKIFVLANPDGVICDFNVYQGTTTFPDYEDSGFGLAERAILTLSASLVPGHILYFDRYFTSVRLLEELLERGIGSSGTLAKNRLPAEIRPILIDDRELKANGRGSLQVLVRTDKKIALTKWFDNKGVIMLSSVEANDNSDMCRRWCKSERRYVDVHRPQVIRNYNLNMGGVDLADRLIAVCPYRHRTKKWTQRMFSHLVDMVISNSWLQYKKDQMRKSVPAKKIAQLRAFKGDLGENLIEQYSQASSPQLANLDSEESETTVQRKRGKPTAPLPSKRMRLQGADHIPMSTEKQSRCRQCHYKKSRFTCKLCNVALCLTLDRNCFLDFHS